MQTVGPRDKPSNQALGLWKFACNAIEIAGKQTLCEEASLEAGMETGLEAMEIAIDTMESALG